MRILVTGGAGFIGTHYVRSVLGDPWGLERPSGVVVLDKLTYAGNRANLEPVANDPRLELVQGDVCDVDLVDRLVASVDAVVHAAAETHVDRSIRGSGEFVRTNVVGSHALLEAARRHRPTKMVQVSTDEVYGSFESGSWTEDEPLLASSPYSASKASADLLARAYHHTYGVPVCITRGPNTYGPY